MLPSYLLDSCSYPGLFFVGLPWLYKQKSGLLVGVGEDADHIVSAIAARESQGFAAKLAPHSSPATPS